MNILKRIFTWWDGATIGTQLFTARAGRKVGTDGAGNVYYKSDSGRRWVIYNGPAEATRVPAEWHGWLHGNVDTPPSEQPPLVRSWEQPHLPNRTGTGEAYRPSGSLDASGRPPAASRGYEGGGGP